MVELTIIYDKVRFEEKALYEKAQNRGIKTQLVDGKTISVTTESEKKDLGFGDVVLQRSVSHYWNLDHPSFHVGHDRGSREINARAGGEGMIVVHYQ